MERNFYCLWLSNIEGIGARNAYALAERFGGAENVWNSSFAEVVSAGFSNTVAGLVSQAKSRDKTEKLIEALENKKIGVISINDECYPDDLRNIYSPPVILYIRGTLPATEQPRLSVIGARRCSEYGANTAFSFAKKLAAKGVVIVSGMAAGIDSVAHKGALAGGGKTIAVLGSGVDICYPAENRSLMEDIINNGCVISEYPPGTRPMPGNFPARNRIISGLSRAVLVVEAGEKSGTLITVDHALEQGKDVFALPGNVTSSSSSGTNSLIRQGASLVTSPEDILDEITRFEESVKPKTKPRPDEYVNDAAMDNDEKNVYGYISGEPAHIESLSQKTGYSIPTLTYVLTCLEIKMLIKKLPGNRYIRSL